MTDTGQSPSKRFVVLPRCPTCGTETPLHAQFCTSCGSSMTVKTVPQTSDHRGQHWLWQDMPPQPPEVRKTAPQVRRHRFRLRPQLVGTILITIVALSAGLAIGYVAPKQPVATTVTSIVHEPPVTITVTITTTTCTTPPPPPPPCSNGRPKWLANTNVVSYLQAANYVGQSKTVEGSIVRTYASTGTVFLDFHDPYQGYFVAVIFSSDAKNFPFPADSFYRNKEVRITGTIQLYQGAPEIIVHSPSQIEVACMGFNYP